MKTAAVRRLELTTDRPALLITVDPRDSTYSV